MKKTILSLWFVLSGILLVQAQQNQDKSQMEKEREDIRQEMQRIQGLYSQVKGQKRETLGQLALLQRKIHLQDRYIDNINRELRYINDDIYHSTLEIIRLQHVLDTLKTQYAKSVVYAYKNRSNYDYLNFIFSATSFNDALKRVQYLKSYRSFREQQVNNIIEIQKLIVVRKQQQLQRKGEKNVALKNQAQQMDVLEGQKKEKDVVVSKLKGQEKELQHQLAEKRKRDLHLKNAIAAIVRREIEDARRKAAEEVKRKAAEEAKANPKRNTPETSSDNSGAANPGTSTNITSTKPSVTTKPKSYLDYSASDVALNNNFEKNRGKLPWPVDNGYVKIHYGTYALEGLNIKGDNPGITIATPSVGATVKAVFTGEVAGVYNLGDAMGITIRHGKYFTTYSNLSSVSVSKGMEVKTGQSIGRAAQADDGDGGQVDFILMIETKKVNPEPWLHR